MHFALSTTAFLALLPLLATALPSPIAGIALTGSLTDSFNFEPLEKRWYYNYTTVRNGRTFTRSSPAPSSTKPAAVSSSKAASSSSVSASPSAPPASPSGAPGSIEYMALKAHNDFRALHGASPLKWNTTLVAGAQTWANNCAWGHSKGAVGPWGENLSATAGYPSTITDGIKFWSDEASSYNATNPTYSHFTQEVWKSTTQLGCAQATCPAGPPGPFDAKYGPWIFYVCEYNPPGNINTKAQYDANVQP